jgi:hypothetical protein
MPTVVSLITNGDDKESADNVAAPQVSDPVNAVAVRVLISELRKNEAASSRKVLRVAAVE